MENITINGRNYAIPDNERKAFTFFRTFLDAVEADKSSTDKEKLSFVMAVIRYALNFEEPDQEQFSELGRIMWKMVVPNIESGITGFLKGSKGAGYGKLGGAPKGSLNNPNGRRGNKGDEELTPKLTPKLTPNKNKDKNKDKNDISSSLHYEDIKENSDELKKTARTVFIPPTLEEVQGYVLEKGLMMAADEFHDYYSANGWMAGRSKMKDWKAAARNWARRQPEFQRGRQAKEDAKAKRDAEFTDYIAGKLTRL